MGALYAIAVGLARRGSPAVRDVLRWRVAAFFYALVLLFLFRPLTQPFVNFPADFITILPPWGDWVRRHLLSNSEMNDLTMQIVPWAHQAREAWRSLQFPLWNPLAGCGYPLLANGQSSAMSPLRLLALPLPLGYALTAEAAMKLLVALTFMYLWCRRRYDELPSAIGAIAFAFSSFLVIWLHFPLVTVAAWLPAAFLAIELLVERRTYRRFVFAVIVWAVMLYGGHPETISHVTFFGGLLALWIAFAERRMAWRDAVRAFGAIAAAVFVAALIAAPFLATFAETVKKSRRFQELEVRGNDAPPYSDFPSAIATFSPHFYGQTPQEKPWGSAVAAESVTGFSGILAFVSWFALLIDAVTRRRFRTREFFLVLLAIVAVGIVFDWPGISAAFHFVFRLAANARLRLLLCWVGAAMTAAAIDMTLRRDMTLRALFGGIAVTGALLLGVIAATDFPTAAAKDTAVIAIAPSLLVLALASLLALPQRWRAVAAMLAGAAAVLELWAATGGWNPVLPADAMYPSTPLIARLRQLQAATPRNAPSRIVGIGAALFPNTNAMYGLADIRTHDPMANGRYLGVLRLLADLRTDDYFAKWHKLDSSLVDFLNVRYVVGEKRLDLPDAQRFRLVYDGRDGRIYENLHVRPRFFAAHDLVLEFRHGMYAQTLSERDLAKEAVVSILPVSGDRMRSDLLAPKSDPTVQIVEADDPSFRLRIRSPRHALIVSSQPVWPGMCVRVDGRSARILPINGAFLGFTIPPGDHDVRVDYVPATFYAGLAASLATLIVLAAWPFAVRRLQRDDAGDSSLRSE